MSSVKFWSVFSKILERIVKKQFLTHLNGNRIIPEVQHGFVSGRSRVTNLLSCLEEWTRNFDNGFQTDVVYLDFSKCFDTVSHEKLLHRLSFLGIQGSALSWLGSFLCGRQQYVCVGKGRSQCKRVTSGVPQGTVLGPILFLCFSFDLYKYVKDCKVSIYADDTKLFKRVMSVDDCRLLQADIDRIYTWAKAWQLTLNPNKTQCIVLGGKKLKTLTFWIIMPSKMSVLFVI